MSEEKLNTKVYDKMSDYIESLFNVFKSVHEKSKQHNDKRLQIISLVIFNYIKYKAKENNINFNEFKEPEVINLIPIFEYIAYNNIELYDFSNINVEDLDTSKNEDLEKFVLTHVYYITQQKK
jgi:hypothetical protein